MIIGILILHIYLPGCRSLKEKRRRLLPFIIRLRKEFNLSVAEVDHQDIWQNTVVACVIVSNESKYIQQVLHRVVNWIEQSKFDFELVDESIELV
jgi:uncharacterized protein YlxP (DUF503 family)